MDRDRWGGRAMKDVVKLIVAILVILIAWKLLKFALGLMVGLIVVGLVVFGAAKLIEGQKRIK
jgi:hypothetical protein